MGSTSVNDVAFTVINIYETFFGFVYVTSMNDFCLAVCVCVYNVTPLKHNLNDCDKNQVRSIDEETPHIEAKCAFGSRVLSMGIIYSTLCCCCWCNFPE